MMWDYLRRQLGLTDLERRIEQLYDERFQLEKLIGELSDQIKDVSKESQARHRVMQDELMDSEARLMTRIEDLESPRPEEKEDTLVSEDSSKTGFTRWSERKRARAAAEISPAVWAKRLTNGNISRPGGREADLRGGNNKSGNGEGQVPEESREQVKP